MLDTETKKRIDDCRDILVGKIPDPKGQVEQITIALIYKFMDDMDNESIEMGGEPGFFVGDYARFAWSRIFDSSLSGHDLLTVYSEAIGTFNKNPNMPELFRDIFKNAYLPFRDPQTLKMFLKEIDKFKYDHSERLGDAFEYLLSVLGSQGDAGQFRTPRHIIDFLVAAVDPQKEDTICDPACGTAGFLISAYKHILEANPRITPASKKKLFDNFVGFDISGDMVRLSLVNLYLHGFGNPKIFEYDTLTSEDRWDDDFDVILANPPFMSPKGGITPHKRFAINAKRSEVLFVDYIAEHLSPKGRAGIIVPEGIIFQSQTAYKALRKMLVDNYLWAVISLPAGVFNPYSGVKTSILLMDKQLAARSDYVLFAKVENDGYGLGAQRREVSGSDLPDLLEYLRQYKTGLLNNEIIENIPLAHSVTKADIAADGDYNLSGERYKATVDYSHVKWPMVELGKICDKITDGSHFSPETTLNGFSYVTVKDLNDGKVDFKNCKKIPAKSYEQLVKNGCAPVENDLLFSKDGTVGKVALIDFCKDFVVLSSLAILSPDIDIVIPRFMYFLIKDEIFVNKAIDNKTGVAIKRIVLRTLKNIRIPLPPLSVQEELVKELEGYQRIIDGCRQIIENWKPQIKINPDWPMVELGEVCEIGGSITKDVDLSLPYYGADSIESHTGRMLKNNSAKVQNVNGPVYSFSGERLLYSKIRPYLNKLSIVNLKGYCSSDMYPLEIKPQIANITYIASYMLSDMFNDSIKGYYERSSIPKINRSQLFSTKIPIPTINEQKHIVSEIESEREIIESNKELMAKYEEKIKQRIAELWE